MFLGAPILSIGLAGCAGQEWVVDDDWSRFIEYDTGVFSVHQRLPEDPAGGDDATAAMDDYYDVPSALVFRARRALPTPEVWLIPDSADVPPFRVPSATDEDGPLGDGPDVDRVRPYEYRRLVDRRIVFRVKWRDVTGVDDLRSRAAELYRTMEWADLDASDFEDVHVHQVIRPVD